MLASTAEEADRAGGEGDAQAALVLLSASAAAAAAFERQDLAIAQWRRALVWLDKSGIAPGNAQRTGVEGALARSLMAVGETGEAVQLLTRLAAPENLALLPARNRVDVLMDLARAHFAGREFQSAAQWAEQALAAAEAALGPEHPAALHTALLLGKALTECQRYPEARAALVRAAEGLDGTSDKAAADEAAQWLEDVEKVLRDRAGE